MVFEVEDLEDDLDVVDVAKPEIDKVYDVDDGIAVARLVVDKFVMDVCQMECQMHDEEHFAKMHSMMLWWSVSIFKMRRLSSAKYT